MSRIAILDTAIDRDYIGGKPIELINLCGENTSDNNQGISHGSLCAKVLARCASDYDLVNIQIFKDNKAKVFGEIAILAQAFELCREIKVDVVSLSAVSSILSDSKYLYDITSDLAKNTIIVSALDNGRYISLPSSYRHVIGVRSDINRMLSPGEVAYRADDPFGANIYANCDFDFLREQRQGPSNSLAVPVVVAYVNNLINQGRSISEINSLHRNLKPYPITNEQEALYYPVRPTEKEIPLVYLVDDTTKTCRMFMDCLNEKYGVQPTALSLIEGPYDVRIKTGNDIGTIQENLHFIEHHYKTDMIFIVGRENQMEEIQKTLNIDVQLLCKGDQTWIKYENQQELEKNSTVLSRLYEILTT